MTGEARKRKTYDLVLIAVSAALITICSWISIPIGAVPFTLQTMAIIAVLMTIGGARGTVAIVVYLLLGFAGVPVFSGFNGGPQVLLGPTGGFLAGFLAASLVWLLLEKLLKTRLSSSAGRRILYGVVNAVVFEVVMYAVGIVWFMYVYGMQTGPIGLGAVMSLCVFPFIIPDVIKLVAAVIIGERAAKIVRS